MRPDCLICDFLTDKIIGSVDHVSDQILNLCLAQFTEAFEALGIVFHLLFESLVHLHTRLIGIQGRGFGLPAFELDMLVVVLVSPSESVDDGPGIAYEPRGLLGNSSLVAAGLDLGRKSKLALISISDLYPGIVQQLLHLWCLPRLG